MSHPLDSFPELARAARNLEERLDIAGIRSEKIPLSEWEALPSEIRALIPDWIPELLSTYQIAGVWLQFDNMRSEKGWEILGFTYPQEYRMYLDQNSYVRDLIGYGFFPFARNCANGSLWVTTLTDGPGGRISFLDHSGWDGDKPTSVNGLERAGKNLAIMLASVSIGPQ
jgi:hypothetical protein